MRDVIIFGTSQVAELLYYSLQTDKDYNVVAFTATRPYINKESFLDKPIICFENIEEVYSPQKYGMFICVGYNDMNQVRESIFKETKAKGYEVMSYTHSSALVQTSNIGEGNIIMEGVIIGAFAKVGDGNIFYAKAHIAHHTVIGNFNFFAISVAIAGNILIKNNCFFGNNCTIRNDIKIDDFTLVGAAAYVDGDTSYGDVYVSPKSIKLEGKTSRDFNLLKIPGNKSNGEDRE